MRGGAQPASGGKPQTLSAADLQAERARLRATPASPERAKALEKITRSLKAIGNRSERNGI